MRTFLPFHTTATRSFILLVLVASILNASPVGAAPSSQGDDSVALCAEGVFYYESGQFDKALPLLEAAIAGHESASFDDQDDLGTCALDLGILYKDSGRFNDALMSFAVALKAFRESGNRVEEAKTLQNTGVTYEYQGNYREALDHYQQALLIVREEHERFGEGVLLDNIGYIYFAQGRHAEALNYYQQALVIEEEVDDQVGKGLTLDNIGSVYLTQGRYQEAFDYYQQSLAIKNEENDLVGQETTLNNLGFLSASQRLYPEALDYYEQALAIQRGVPDWFRQGTTLHNIGLVYLEQGRYGDALDSFQRALAIQSELGDRRNEALTLNSMGLISQLQGDYPTALAYYEKALNLVREVGVKADEASGLVNIGYLYQATNEFDKALTYYEQALDLFETIRAAAGSETSRTTFIAQHAYLYDVAMEVYHEQGQDEQAFLVAERGRARAFLDSLATGTIQLSDNQAAELYAQEQEAFGVRQAAQEALSEAKEQNPQDEQLLSALERQLASAETNYQAKLDAITAYGGQLSQLTSARNTVLDLRETQALLDETTTLISFWVLRERTLVFIVTREDFQTVELSVRQADLVNQVTSFHAFSNTEDPHPSSSIKLYDLLILPLEPYLNSQHLIIVPHAILHSLPFAALTDGQQYLIDNHVITYLPSASTLPFIQQNVDGTQAQALIMGNPTTGDYDTVASLAAKREQLDPLPFAQEEAEIIGSQLGVQPLLASNATETIVKHQAPQTKILHLAAHGLFNEAAPLSSFVALAPDSENDGWLTVSEVYGLDLVHTDLVVLSACETQIGERTAGDDLVGLTRAFFFAGTPTVVASLWNVDDRATAILMQSFYMHMGQGMEKAEALRQAQRDVREQYPNPYYWAAFVLSGDGGKMMGIKNNEVIETQIPLQTPTADPARFPNWAIVLLVILLIVVIVQFSKRQSRR